MIYKNISACKKTFYGVVFNPGDIKEVPGYVNDRQMIVESSLPDKKEAKEINASTKKSNSVKSSNVKATSALTDKDEAESKSIKEEENG